MVRGLLVLSLLIAVSCSNSNFVNLENPNGIIGGTEIDNTSEIGKFTVSIQIKKLVEGNVRWNGECSGVIVAPTLILTSAHCYFGKQSVNYDQTTARVIFDHSLINISNSKFLDAKDFILNPKYIPYASMWTEDLAIIRLRESVPAPYQPVPILSDFSVLQNGIRIHVAGYGISSEIPEVDSLHLKFFENMIIEARNDSVWTYSSDKKAHCFGDSGGPALFKKDGQFYLWGTVTSGRGKEGTGKKCNRSNMYTRLDYLKDFLEPYLKNPNL